jgi:type VI secretion system protein ImpJ
MHARPLWTEGTLLCPQHLQQQDLHHERLLAARLAVVSPNPWGVLAVRFDPAALQAGRLALTHLRAVLPDGTPVDLDEHTPPPPRALAPHFAGGRERVTVHLGVPALRPGAANAAAEPTPGQRWRSFTRAVPDLTAARSARDIDLVEAHLQLRLGDEPIDDLASLPLAEVVRDSAGGFALDPGFAPPLAAVSAAPWLRAGLQDLLAAVTARLRVLAGDRRRQQELPRALLFQTLSGAAPLLRDLVDDAAAAPRHVHQHLLRLAGELGALAVDDPRLPAPELPGFVFTDPRASFGALLPALQRLVAELLPDRHLAVPLEARPDGLWIGELRDERLLRGATFVLAVESDADPAVLAGELPALTRIASWRRISLIVRNNVLGAAIRPLPHPPPWLPAHPRTVHFAISADDPSWLEVLRERNVALYLPPPYDPDRARVSLLAAPGAHV